jgi:hypothetical protein
MTIGRKSLHFQALPWFYEHVCKNVYPDLRIGSLLYALCIIAFMAILAYILDKKKIYIRV